LVPTDSDIRQILKDRIDRYRQSVGLVAGVIEPTGRRVVAYGTLDQSSRQPVDGDTIFEVGSVTKVFTAVILADMVQRQEVALGDPASKYLPVGVTLPERGGRQITLLDLATHTSGLPPDPPDLDPRDPCECRHIPVSKARCRSRSSSRVVPQGIRAFPILDHAFRRAES
jgi:D-alanyl-D-alanine-carboxypeptidase/D-alanyl-D-alanine-endopeptidase